MSSVRQADQVVRTGGCGRDRDRTDKGEPGAFCGCAFRMVRGQHRSRSFDRVRNYMSEAIGKLGVTNRIAAAQLARDRGWH